MRTPTRRPALHRRAAAPLAAAALAGVALAAGAGGDGLGLGPATASAALAQDSIPSSERTGRVRLSRSSSRVSVRDRPGGRRIGSLKHGARARVSCQVNGPAANGRLGRSRIWDRTKASNGRMGYVSDATIDVDKGSLVAKYCRLPDPATIGDAREGGTTQGHCASRAPVTVQPPFADRASFVAAIGPSATESQRRTGVPAAVTLAQGILESASGTANAGANNYFGIKARETGADGVFSWGDVAQACVHKPTSEQEGSRLVRRIAQFRAYADVQGSLVDHGLFLRQNSRYAPAFAFSGDPERFAREIHRAGYATDAKYSSKLIALMRAEDLARFDAR